MERKMLLLLFSAIFSTHTLILSSRQSHTLTLLIDRLVQHTHVAIQPGDLERSNNDIDSLEKDYTMPVYQPDQSIATIRTLRRHSERSVPPSPLISFPIVFNGDPQHLGRAFRLSEEALRGVPTSTSARTSRIDFAGANE